MLRTKILFKKYHLCENQCSLDEHRCFGSLVRVSGAVLQEYFPVLFISKEKADDIHFVHDNRWDSFYDFTKTNSNWGVSVREFNWICFGYKMPSTSTTYFSFVSMGRWWQIAMNPQGRYLEWANILDENLMEPPIIADNTWRHTCANVFQ